MEMPCTVRGDAWYTYMEGISMSRARHYHEVWKASARAMEGIVTNGAAVLLCMDGKIKAEMFGGVQGIEYLCSVQLKTKWL